MGVNNKCPQCGYIGSESQISALSISDKSRCLSCGYTRTSRPNQASPHQIGVENATARKNDVLKGILLTIAVIALGLGQSPLARSLASSSEDGNPASKASYAEKTEWKTIESAEGGFSVSFPTEPDVATSTIDLGVTTELTRYVSQTEYGEVYVAEFLEYPVEVGEIDLMGTVPGVEGLDIGLHTIESSEAIVDGHSALDYVIYNSREEEYMTGTNILVDRKLYMLVTFSATQQSIGHSRFVRSFRFVD